MDRDAVLEGRHLGLRAGLRTVTAVAFTFQDGELGAGADLPNGAGGRALVDGFIPVGPQRLDPQHGA